MISRLPPRLRFFVWLIYSGTLGWLAAVGLTAMIDGRARVPDPSGFAVFFIILGLAALTRNVPARFQAQKQ